MAVHNWVIIQPMHYISKFVHCWPLLFPVKVLKIATKCELSVFTWISQADRRITQLRIPDRFFVLIYFREHIFFLDLLGICPFFRNRKKDKEVAFSCKWEYLSKVLNQEPVADRCWKLSFYLLEINSNLMSIKHGA